jgi:N-acetylmuramate 1-kinase
MDFFTPDDFLYHTRQRMLGWGSAELQLDAINKGGSDRQYFRIRAKNRTGGPPTVILMAYTTVRPDNASFFATTEVLRKNDIRCPAVFSHDPDHRLAWIEDLGEDDLWAYREQDPQQRLTLYRNALEMVGRLHTVQKEDVPAHLLSHLQPDFDEGLYRWEQGYFFEHFASNFSVLTPCEQEQIRNQGDLSEMAESLGNLPRFLVHRDFQSQNISVRGGKTFFIDHQGLRAGRPEYDVASLLYDPYVNFTEEERGSLEECYFTTRPPHNKWDSNTTIYAQCACQRLMQALGAYGNLGIRQGKPQFLRHIPSALANLTSILDAHPDLLPGLRDVLELRKDQPVEELFSADLVSC